MNKYIPLLILVGIFGLLFSFFVAKNLTSAPACESIDVCGYDGISYTSSCALRDSGATIASYGACDAQIKCAAITVPVCGINGVTYDNECIATRMNNVSILHRGVC
jgi:hypothetical protein